MSRQRTRALRICLCGCGQQTGNPIYAYLRNHKNRVTFAERFWLKLDKNAPGGCWLWKGAVGQNGYGEVQKDKQKHYTHRVAYELTYGAIPNGLYVCHTCDVRHCCNPQHLWLGTNADNIRDAARKGRLNRGERNGSSRLTRGDVIAIRAEYRTRGANHAVAVAIAKERSVSPSANPWCCQWP